MTQHAPSAPGLSAPLTEGEMAFGLAGLPAPAVTPAEAPAPKVRWLTDKKLVHSYALEYPFELDSVEYRTIIIKRLSAREVELFLETMRGEKTGRPVRWPLYFVDGVPLPEAAWDAMMDDDRFALGEIGIDFLPARFREPTGDQRT